MTTTESTRTVAWQVDKAHSQVGFAVKHMMFTSVRGRFTDLDAEIVLDTDDPNGSYVEVEIDAASIDTSVGDRDQHLRSGDFLDVENHPKITFRSRRVEGASFQDGERFKVVGDLTIRGTTREVELDATFHGRGRDPWGQEKAGFTAETKIDRHEFGLTWNQALETGGVLVGREVKITVEAQFTKPKDE